MGTLFEIAARYESKVINDGSRWYRIFSQEGKRSVQYCGARGDEPRNKADIYSVSLAEDTVKIDMEGTIMKLNVDESIVSCGQVINSASELFSMGLSPIDQAEEAKVMTKYKPVAKKVKPVNIGLKLGEGLEVTEKQNTELVTQANPV